MSSLLALLQADAPVGPGAFLGAGLAGLVATVFVLFLGRRAESSGSKTLIFIAALALGTIVALAVLMLGSGLRFG